MIKKKILLIALHYYPFIGGAEISLQNNFERLSNDFDITLITPKHSKKNLNFENLNGIKIFRVGIGIRSIDKYLFILLGFFKGLNIKYDLLFCLEANQSSLVGRFLNIFKEKPTIVNIQAGFTEEFVKNKLGIFYFIYNFLYSKNFYYQVLSNDLKQRCISHNCNKITLIPNAYDDKVFNKKKNKKKINEIKSKLKILDKDKVLITTSRLSKKNGVEDVIKSLKYLPKNVKFLICGEGELKEDLINLVKKLKLNNRVLFLGSIKYSDLPNYIHSSHIFIRPSLFEGFGNSFVEALACGIPIIGTKVGGIPDFLIDKETGLFVGVQNSRDIANKVKLLIEDEKLYLNISNKGEKLVKNNYTWDIVAKQTKKHINKILK